MYVDKNSAHRTKLEETIQRALDTGRIQEIKVVYKDEGVILYATFGNGNIYGVVAASTIDVCDNLQALLE